MKRAACLTAAFFLAACGAAAPQRAGLPKNAEALKKQPDQSVQTFELQIERRDLTARLSDPETSRAVRLIRIFGRDKEPSEFRAEYRIFGVRTGSVYDVLGLRNNDILVAVDGYSITAPQNFPDFVWQLRNESSGVFEIRRGGEPLLIKIRITG